MKVMIDTNIILDVYMNRVPFAEVGVAVLKLSEKNQIAGTITANTITDIYYLLGRHIKDAERVRSLLLKLISVVTVTDVLSADVTRAFSLSMIDYEDALLAQCASRVKAAYIITRNEKDFTNSPVPAISPQEFLAKFQ